jgi:hypothetical protein
LEGVWGNETSASWRCLWLCQEILLQILCRTFCPGIRRFPVDIKPMLRSLHSQDDNRNIRYRQQISKFLDICWISKAHELP